VDRAKKKSRKSGSQGKTGRKSDPIWEEGCLSPEALDEASNRLERLIFGFRNRQKSILKYSSGTLAIRRQPGVHAWTAKRISLFNSAQS
jgi:hypothetical protein